MKKFSLIITLMLLLIVPNVISEDIAYEGFESGSFCGGSGWGDDCWTTTGSNSLISWGNTPYDSYELMMSSKPASISRSINISSYESYNVSFAVKIVSFEYDWQGIPDKVGFYVSIDNQADILVHEWSPEDSDNGWHDYNFDLSDYEGDVLELKFISSMSDFGDEFHLDHIQVKGSSQPLNEIILTIPSLFPISTTATIYFSSTEINTIHNLKITNPSGEIICENNILSPMTAYTLTETNCELPDYSMTDAKAFISIADDPNINATHFFNTVELQEDKDMLKIKNVYFSPQVLQGGYSEIFMVIEKGHGLNITQRTLKLTYPNNSSRTLYFNPTSNEDEYRAFITDTFLTGNVSFTINVQSEEYHDEYSNNYFVVPYNLDFVEAVNQVLRIMTQPPNIDVLGTYYEVGDTAKIIAQLSDQGKAINNATCYASAYYPDGSVFTRNSYMSYIPNSDGIYHFDIILPDITGVYPVSAVCDYQTYEEEIFIESINLINGTFISGYLNYTYYSDDEVIILKSSPVTGEDYSYLEALITYDVSGISFQNNTDIFAYMEGNCNAIGSEGQLHWYNWNTDNWDSSENTITHYLEQQSFLIPGNILDYINSSNKILLKFNGTNPLIPTKSVFFYEDWENGNINGWDFEKQAEISTTTPINGSYSLYFEGKGGANSYSRAYTNISTINKTNITLSYYHTCYGMESNDEFWVYTSNDGSNWDLQQSYSGNIPLTYRTINLDSSYENTTIYISFEQDTNQENDICIVDDVRLTSYSGFISGFEIDVFNLEFIGIGSVVNEVRGGAEFNVKDRMNNLEDLIGGIISNQTNPQMSFNPPYNYYLGETAVISHRLTYSFGGNNNIETGANCTINIFGPANDTGRGPEFSDNMTEVGAGSYSYNFIPSGSGTYSIESNCNKDNRYYYSLTTLKIERPIDSYNTQITPTHSTIYNLDEESIVSARLTYINSGYQYLELDASCYLSVYGPSNSTGFGPKILNNSLMSEHGNGIYFKLVNPIYTGVYTAEIDCNNSNRNYHTISTMRIERDIYAYLVGVIEAKIDNMTIKLNNLTFSSTSETQLILDELYAIRNNVSQNYNELQDIKNELDDIDYDLSDILDNQNMLIYINNSIELLTTYVQENLTNEFDYVNSLLNNINYTLTGLDTYVKQNLTIYINNLQQGINDLLINQSNTINILNSLDSNITNNHQELLVIKQLVQDVNSSIITEINKNEQLLNLLNTTTNLIYSEILTSINPSLSLIEGNLSSMQTDIDIIYQNTDSLESGQVLILNNLSNIESQLSILNQSELLLRFDSVDLTLSSLSDELDFINSKLDCNSSNNVICDAITSLDFKLDALNTSILSIDDYLRNNVSSDLSNIFSLVTSLNLTVSGIEDYLYTNLSSDISIIHSDLSSIISNTSQVLSSLGIIQSNITDQFERLDILEYLLVSVNSTILDVESSLTLEINKNEQLLNLLNTTTNLIYSEILTSINPSLSLIEGNLSSMQTDIDIIYQNTDSLESGQVLILNNLSNIESQLTILNQSELLLRFDSVDLTLSSLSDELDFINSKLDCNSSNNVICDAITSLDFKLDALNTSILSVDDYLRNDITSDLSNIFSFLGSINLTITGLEDYVLNNLSSKIDLIQSDLINLNYNVSTIISEISNLQNNISNQDTQIMILQSMLQSVNNTILDSHDNLSLQIFSNHQNLVLLNNTINSIYAEIINNINPSLNDLDHSLVSMHSDISVILNNTDILSDNQQDIFSNLTYIESLILGFNSSINFDLSNLDSKLDNLSININNIESRLDCSHTTNIICDRIDSLQSSIFLLNFTVEDINDYLHNNVSSDLSYITDIIYNVNLSVSGLYSYINNTLFPEFDNLESYLISVMSNQTILYDEILNLQTNVSLNNAQLDFIEDLIISVNGSLSSGINDNMIKIDLITHIVNETQYYVENNLTLKIDQISSIVSSLNLSIQGIESFLNTNITPMILNINTQLDALLLNSSNMWDLMVIMQSNLTSNTDDLGIIKGMIESVNITQNNNAGNLLFKINQNSLKLDSLNSTINIVLTRIQDVVEPKLDMILNNVSGMQTDIDIIQNSLSVLESNQAEIQGNISILHTSIYDLHSNFSLLNNDVSNLTSIVLDTNQSMHQRFDNLYDLIDNVSISLNSSIASISFECNSTGYSICEMLDFIRNDTRKIRNDTDFIKNYLLENITDMLTDINGSVSDLYDLNYEMNNTLRDILTLLNGGNASNLYPVTATIHNPINIELTKHSLELLINTSINSSSGAVLNYLVLSVWDSNNNLKWQNTSTFINSESIDYSAIIRPYYYDPGNYTLTLEAYDIDGYFGIDSSNFKIINQIPNNPILKSPIGGEVFIGSINVTWNGTIDEDQDDLSLDFEYSKDNGASWKPAFNGSSPFLFINHTCDNTSNILSAKGNFSNDAETYLNRIHITLFETGVYNLTLNNSIGIVEESTAWCINNESCKFIFNSTILGIGNYSWEVREINTNNLASSPHCEINTTKWLYTGNHSSIKLFATPISNLVNWDVSSFSGSTNYLLRARAYDGYDYSNWTESDTKWTIIQPNPPTTGSGSSSSSSRAVARGDFMYCNLATGECWSRDEIEGDLEEESTLFSFIPFSDNLKDFTVLGALKSLSNGTKNLGNSITGAVTSVGDYGEKKFNIPSFIFLILIVCIIVLSFILWRKRK